MDRLGQWLMAPILVSALQAAAWAAQAPVDPAAVALHAGNASDAAALATQALTAPGLAPADRARLLVDRGLAQEMLGTRDAALVDFTQAIDGHALAPPDLAHALYDRGVTLDELSRTEDAIGDYSAAIRIEPNFAAALNNRANAYRRLGKTSQARADYEASLAAGNPRVEYPNYGLGQLAEAAGDVDAARGYYRAALAADPKFTLANERLAAIGADDPPIVLRAPGAAGADGVLILRPPMHRRHADPDPPASVPDLKPALGDMGDHGGTVQLGAWRSQGEAANSWSRIARASGTLLVGHLPDVEPVDLPGKGRYYRLRTSAGGGGAEALCTALQAKGLACIVVRN